MKTFSRIGMAVLIALALSFATSVQAKPQQATAKQVRQLLKATGAAGMMHGMMARMNSQMSNYMQHALPCVPASYWNGFAGKSAEKDLINRMIPIYQRHFTSQDVAGLLKFYRTPLGQKVIHEMPKTMREAMQVGQNWGKGRAQQMIAKLKKNGTLDADGKCPAPKRQNKMGDK